MLSIIQRIVGNAFDIDVKKNDCCRLDVLQNSHAKFEYGQVHTLKPHLVYDQGWTLHLAFLLAVEDLVPTTTMHQTQDQL
jgi:hypothetical protein